MDNTIDAKPSNRTGNLSCALVKFHENAGVASRAEQLINLIENRDY